MGRLSLKARVGKLERAAGAGECSACGPHRLWLVDEEDEVREVNGVSHYVLICERCGMDWTGRGSALMRFLWDLV